MFLQKIDPGTLNFQDCHFECVVILDRNVHVMSFNRKSNVKVNGNFRILFEVSYECKYKAYYTSYFIMFLAVILPSVWRLQWTGPMDRFDPFIHSIFILSLADLQLDWSKNAGFYLHLNVEKSVPEVVRKWDRKWPKWVFGIGQHVFLSFFL